MAQYDSGDARGDPDALLSLSGRAGRGKLTVFVGAAPGVGKTFSMLQRARRLKAEGIDVIVGLVETHGRKETLEQLEGLEILPRRQMQHGGHLLEEFDVDAALGRKPQTIVVDELAHSNSPGSRHPKRYQDIEELLSAGIDVWTALNIQHLESLADVVGQITGAQVREKVPDIVLKQADEVLLIDVSPAELIQRLNEGKVYLPGNARRAAESYFRLGNLTALRDLALRRTADRVDDQVIDYVKQNAIQGPWLSAERLLVCVGADGLSEKVIHTASRLASGLNAPWIVVSLERSSAPLSAADDAKLFELFGLAERLGAQTKRVKGTDFVEQILKLARREHATQIVIGMRRRSFLRRHIGESLVDAIMARSAGISVHVVTSSEAAAGLPMIIWRPPSWIGLARDTGIAALSVAVATFVGISIKSFLPLPNASIIFLLAVLASAASAGYAAALAAAIFSAFAYNFFFIDPIASFRVAQPHELFALAVFLIAAVLGGGLASRLREQLKISGDRAMATQTLYDLSRKLSGAVEADDLLWVVVNQLQASTGRSIVIMLAENGDVAVKAAWPPDTELDVTDMTAARWAFNKREPAGYGTDTLPNSGFNFLPLRAPSGVIGVCGIKRKGADLDVDVTRTIDVILDQAAVAIDRARLSAETLEQAAALEGGRFRSALLASVSHDLKTPLATITGAVTTLRHFGGKMRRQSQDELLGSIEEEGGRLTRFLANLLDMTKIDSGSIAAKREWIDVADVVHSAVGQIRKVFPGKQVDVKIAVDLPLIRGDSVLLGQVLFNLLDNAFKYAGEHPVAVFARADGAEVLLSVVDKGRGISPQNLERIFEKFFRRDRSDGRAPGTGLGLAIAKGFTEAMGGTIRAESPAVKNRGTRVTLRFPIEKPGEISPGSE